MKTKKPFILIDGSSYLYRAFHALPPLTNSKGEPTGAIYGVINMIRKLLKDYEPDYIAVIFDPKGKTFRHEIYKEYKAHRPPMADDLQRQIKPLQEIIKAMGLPLLIIEGEEADDVIGTLAREATRAGMPVLISTGDKDMAQLVNDDITLINTMTGIILDAAGVKNKFGVTPERMIDYLALIGDSVDNIPGVEKVGPKTAVKWLQEFGSLENIIKNADKISGKVGENLRAALATLPLSRELVTIRENLTLLVHPKDLTPKEPDIAALQKWFSTLEFRAWLTELLNHAPQASPEKYHYEIIFDENHLRELCQQLQQAKTFSFDTETTSLNFVNAELVGVAFAVKAGEAFYVPVGHDYPNAPQQIPKDIVIQHLKALLENTELTVVGYNLKYDINVLAKYGIQLKAKFFDTMLESYVLNSTSTRHDMDSLSLKYLSRRTILFEDIAGKASQQLSCNQISIEKVGEYAGQDADVTLQLHQYFMPKLTEKTNLMKVLNLIELPLLPVLAEMEYNGVSVDVKKLRDLSEEFAKRIKELEVEAHRLAGQEFNLSSPKQLQEIFYQKLNLPIQRKTAKGQPSTSEEVLQELALDYPLPKVILEHRTLTKLKSTFTDALMQQIDPKTQRVHTSYNQAITSTGRLSSTDPNLQNIPIRTEAGRRIRQAFVARHGYKIVSADYSQIELRIMAHLSQDKNLVKAFAEDSDIHRATAAEVFNVPLDKVTAEQRRSAKMINFGLIYGMSTFGLARRLGVPREVAQKYIDLYFQRYPGVKHYMESICAVARQQGYVETLFGRRVYVPEIYTSNLMRRRAAERAAINGPMQGTAADIIKIAMAEIDKWIKYSKLDIKMIMQVHDELVFEIAEKDVEKAIPPIRSAMSHAIELKVPILVEIGIGDNWDEAH